jgi:hypothetical protein
VLLAILLVLCAAILAYGIWSGYRSGAVAQLFTLGTILVCYLVAGGIAWTGVAIPGFRSIPRLLQPFVFGAVAAIVLYVLLSRWTRHKLEDIDEAPYYRAKAAGIENPEVEKLSEKPANRKWGMVVGGLKSLIVVAALFLVLHFISMTTILAEDVMQARERQGEGPQERSAVHRFFHQMGREMKSSPVGPLANSVAPVKEKQVEMLGKVSRLSENPAAMNRFQRHPKVKELMNHPRILALAKDPEIAKAVEEKRWFDLLDNPAIVALARDAELQRLITQMDFEKILNETSKTPKRTARKPARSRRSTQARRR